MFANMCNLCYDDEMLDSYGMKIKHAAILKQL